MEKIGLISGNGKLPSFFINKSSEKNYEVFPIYLFDNVEEEIKNHKNAVKISVGQVGKIIKHLKKNGIKKVIMLGKVEKDLIFSNFKFDLTATKIILSSKDKKDNNIVMSIINFLESEEIKVLPQNFLLDDLMVQNKTYTKIEMSSKDQKTADIGIEAAKMLTHIDAGQTAISKKEYIVALEGIEGTDKTILRAGELAGKGCIVVKLARRDQDFRIDMPTIGMQTIKNIVDIKAKGIILECDKMLFIDQEEVIKFANKNKIFIKGISV